MRRPHGGELVDRVLKGKHRKKAAKTASNLEKVEVSRTIATDTENIAKGIFSPLQGFMTPSIEKDYTYPQELKKDSKSSNTS